MNAQFRIQAESQYKATSPHNISEFDLFNPATLDTKIENDDKRVYSLGIKLYDADIFTTARMLHRSGSVEEPKSWIENNEEKMRGYEELGHVWVASCNRGKGKSKMLIGVRYDLDLMDEEREVLSPKLIQIVSSLPELLSPFKSKEYYLSLMQNL